MEALLEYFDKNKTNHFLYNDYFKNATTPMEAIKNYLNDYKLEDAIRCSHIEKLEFEISYKKENNKVYIYNEVVQKYLSTPFVFTIIKSSHNESNNYNLGEIIVQDTITENMILNEIQKWIDLKNIPLKVVILTNDMQRKESFINDIINVYKKYNLSLSHEDTQGAFKIEKYNDENVDWIKETLRYGINNDSV